MQGLQIIGFDEFGKALSKAATEAPKNLRKLHTELADMAKSEVDKSISGNVNDSHGKIKSWQRQSVGSRGGYAVVRPVGGQSGSNSPGAITNYLEGGHRTRRPSGTAKRPRRSRAKMAYVDGRHFYEAAAEGIEAPAYRLADDYLKKIRSTLEG